MEQKLSKKTIKLLEQAKNLKQVAEEVAAELKLVNIKLQKEIKQGEGVDYMGYKFIHKQDSERTSLDQKALKEAHPTIFEEFAKTSTVKGSLTITKPKAN